VTEYEKITSFLLFETCHFGGDITSNTGVMAISIEKYATNLLCPG
jgi:hypothetical protein